MCMAHGNVYGISVCSHLTTLNFLSYGPRNASPLIAATERAEWKTMQTLTTLFMCIPLFLAFIECISAINANTKSFTLCISARERYEDVHLSAAHFRLCTCSRHTRESIKACIFISAEPSTAERRAQRAIKNICCAESRVNCVNHLRSAAVQCRTYSAKQTIGHSAVYRFRNPMQTIILFHLLII